MRAVEAARSRSGTEACRREKKGQQSSEYRQVQTAREAKGVPREIKGEERRWIVDSMIVVSGRARSGGSREVSRRTTRIGGMGDVGVV
jgi:hypothetical protein